ncbi:hypothetical protein M1146_05750 [Patescibacteria group bacterium]|nr:hypothetical protein [Patescibacteria group bacterium]
MKDIGCGLFFNNPQLIAYGSPQQQSQPPMQAVSSIPTSSDPYKQALPPPFSIPSQSLSSIQPNIQPVHQQITKSAHPSQPIEQLSRVTTVGSVSANDQDIDIVDQLFAVEPPASKLSSQELSKSIKPQQVETTIPAKPISPEQSKANTASIPIVIPPIKSTLQRAGQAVPQAYISPRSDQKTERISTPPPTIQAETILDQEQEELKQLKELFERFLELRKECGEAEISFEIFSEQIHTARNQYIANHGWTPLKFNVYIKNNKVALKAKPIKL